MAITQNLDSQRFEYTGDVQEFIVPAKGLYKLEVFGAAGGNLYHGIQAQRMIGGLGGYSVGYIYLENGQTLNICVGGHGGDCGNLFPETMQRNYALGGYNGGGVSGLFGGEVFGTGGGGATHIVLGPIREASSPNDIALGIKKGVLSNYENYKSEVLIVAGGGGGGVATYGHERDTSEEDGVGARYPVDLIGGSGGGLIGGDGSTVYDEINLVGYGPGHGGTQNGPGQASSVNERTAKFGRSLFRDPSLAGDPIEWSTPPYAGGGGAGWYGGNTGGQEGAGGGGSGYIGGVPTIEYKGQTYTPSTVSGYNLGNGAAVITLIQKSAPSVYLGSREISAIYYGTRDITDIKIHN